MKLKTISILSGVVFLISDGLLIYYQGHKNSSVIRITSGIFTFTGWIIILGSLFGERLLRDKIKFKRNKLLWLKDKIIKASIYITFGICVVATFAFIDKCRIERITKILKTKPTANVIGVITEIESRNTRGGSKLWGIIEYQTKTTKVKQAVYNYNNKYSVGQRYLIRYSIDNPEMFEITDRLK